LLFPYLHDIAFNHFQIIGRHCKNYETTKLAVTSLQKVEKNTGNTIQCFDLALSSVSEISFTNFYLGNLYEKNAGRFVT